jgi:hypothetical protein
MYELKLNLAGRLYIFGTVSVYLRMVSVYLRDGGCITRGVCV